MRANIQPHAPTDHGVPRLERRGKRWSTAGVPSQVTSQTPPFVHPGHFPVEIDAETAPGVLVSAFKNESSRQLVVVAISENEGAQELEFRLTGPSAASAMPCRTSETEDLATLPELRMVENTLTAALAPVSVTSFVAQCH